MVIIVGNKNMTNFFTLTSPGLLTKDIWMICEDKCLQLTSKHKCSRCVILYILCE